MSRSIGRILDLAVQSVPTRLAVTLGQDQAWTFQELDRRANRMARTLAAHGLTRGDRLMYWSPIALGTIELFFATQRLGVAFVPINHAYSVEEVRPLLDYIRPHLFVVGAELGPQAEALQAQTGVAVAVMGLRDNWGPGWDLDAESAHADDGPLAPQGVDDEDIQAIFLTSGSTGLPKGVMLSHRATWMRALLSNTRTIASGGRGEVNMFPLFHWGGWHFTLGAWMQRRTIHLTRQADAGTLWGLVEHWRPSWMYCIPAVWERLLEDPSPRDVASLRYAMTGTYRVEPRLIEAIRARIPGVACSIGWGATELGVGLILGDDDIERKPYSVGLPAPASEVALIDGELCARSDQMMSGYYDLPEQTAGVLKDGWYYSGDLADRDDEGYFTINGRRREVIRSGAEAIAPAEVEAAIKGFPGIRDVCVVGLPDTRWGEIVCAVVVLAPGAALPEVDALRAHVTPHLASFKHPRRVVALDGLPRTSATGQIQRSQVRDVIVARLAG